MRISEKYSRDYKTRKMGKNKMAILERNYSIFFDYDHNNPNVVKFPMSVFIYAKLFTKFLLSFFRNSGLDG